MLVAFWKPIPSEHSLLAPLPPMDSLDDDALGHLAGLITVTQRCQMLRASTVWKRALEGLPELWTDLHLTHCERITDEELNLIIQRRGPRPLTALATPGAVELELLADGALWDALRSSLNTLVYLDLSGCSSVNAERVVDLLLECPPQQKLTVKLAGTDTDLVEASLLKSLREATPQIELPPFGTVTSSISLDIAACKTCDAIEEVNALKMCASIELNGWADEWCDSCDGGLCEMCFEEAEWGPKCESKPCRALRDGDIDKLCGPCEAGMMSPYFYCTECGVQATYCCFDLQTACQGELCRKSMQSMCYKCSEAGGGFCSRCKKKRFNKEYKRLRKEGLSTKDAMNKAGAL